MSSNAGYTKGPWTYYRDTCRACDEKGVAEFVILEPPGGNHGQFSNEADARLIAASPELLEALKGLVSLAKDCVADAEDWHDYQHAVAVIAKAEGK